MRRMRDCCGADGTRGVCVAGRPNAPGTSRQSGRGRTLWALALGLLCLALAAPPARAQVPDPTPAEAQSAAQVRDDGQPACDGAGLGLSIGRPFADQRLADYTVLYGATNRYGKLHTGLDFPSPTGMAVLAGADGRVVAAGNDAQQAYGPRPNYYGNLVILQVAAPAGAPPVYVLYGHLSRVSVQAGQDVLAGQPVGEVGMTGIAVGPHLHLEVRCGGAALADTRNPGLWLSPVAGQGLIAGRLLDARGRPVAADRLLVYRVGESRRLWRIVWTYPAGTAVNADDALQENFVLPDVPAGDYVVVAGRGARVVSAALHVTAGQMAWVDLRLP